jgi:hypothetical protein
MTWTVSSNRLPWPEGQEVSRDDLASCNIMALEAGGHLTPVTRKKPLVAASEEE